MSLPDVDHIKSSIHIDYDDDDATLLDLRDTAVAYFQSIGVAFDPEDCPKPIGQAVTLFVKYFYDHGISLQEDPGTTSSIRLPWAVVQLIAPYKEIVL